GIVQPIVIMAFMALALMVFDKILYDQNYGVFKKLDKDTLEKCWRGPQERYGAFFGNQGPQYYADNYKLKPGWQESGYARNPLYRYFSGETRDETPDWDRLDCGKNHNKTMKEGMTALVAGSITALLILMMQDQMPTLVQNL